MPHPAVGRIPSSLRSRVSTPDPVLRGVLSQGPATARSRFTADRLHDSPGAGQIDHPQPGASPHPGSDSSEDGSPRAGMAARLQSPSCCSPGAVCDPGTRSGPTTRSLGNLLTGLLTTLVRGYQLFISPVLPSACRFHPTCSEYMRQAIVAHGPFRGVALGLKRLGKCHPWHEGGLDPVPTPLENRHG